MENQQFNNSRYSLKNKKKHEIKIVLVQVGT